jgi:hypothetical protein
MARNTTDSRQITLRAFLQQIANASTYAGTADAKAANTSELDNLLQAIDDELQPLLRLSASSTPDLIVAVGSATKVNSESSRTRSIPHIGALLPNSFTSGTVTFPASSGGTITVSPGNNGILTVSSGNYIKVLIYMDATGALNVLPGVENAVEATASVLAAPKKTLPIGYVTLQNIAGVIQPIAQAKIYQFGTGSGGASTGSGSGIGDDLNSLTFRADVTDLFEDIPSSTDSAVDISAGKTDSATYSAANAYYRLAYDATRTVTGTGTAMTLSGTPSFTVKIGDMLRVGTEARRITAVGTQTTPTIESAFTTDPSVAACTVSQAVYTKDMNALTVDGLAISAAFTGNISQIMVDYEDSTAADDVIFDANTAPVVAWSASSDGTTYSVVSARPTNLIDDLELTNLPAPGTSLVVRFFSNKTTGSGFVNLLQQKTFFHRDEQFEDGSILNQAMCFTDGIGTEINCSAPSVVSGKTRVELTTFTFPVDVNSGTANGALKVYLNGQKIPRYIDATLTPDASYREIDQKTIELDGDYSALNLSLEIIQDVAAIDNIDTNTSNITVLQEINRQGFQAFVNENARLTATAVTGSPVAGTFYSTVVNRAAIPDLTANLKAQMGIERIATQALQQVQNEFGPNGERVFGAVNDEKGLIRYIGVWSSALSNNGARTQSSTSITTDYVEVTFYGTGLNILSLMDAAGYDFRYRVDGGAESGNVLPALTFSGILQGRGTFPNIVVPIVSGLALGVHTVQIRNNGSGLALPLGGVEILNESTSIKLNPGSSYINGKKLTLNSQQTFSPSTTFESGVLGTRGGRVVVYQKSDGTIAKAVTPVNPSLAVLLSADHTNEEVIKTHHYREFGANRADDFSTLVNSTSNRAFTLEDGTTTLIGSQVSSNTTSNIDVLNMNNAGTDHYSIAFVGTGLDIVGALNGATGNVRIYVDNVLYNPTPATAFQGQLKKMPIVSGLPYGTHTVKFERTPSHDNFQTSQFIIYGPKKPAIPAGAIELADYNVMADYTAATGHTVPSGGVLTKACTREFMYTGSWGAVTLTPVYAISGFYSASTTIGDTVSYTFFGTGIEAIVQNAGTNASVSVKIDDVLYTGAATPIVAGGGGTWTPGTSTWAFSAISSVLNISGLPLGKHKITLTNLTTNDVRMVGASIITPIHSPKSNIYADLMNALPTGSCGISDNRKTSAIKEALPSQKAWAQAIGITSGPTTTSTAFVPCPDMSLTIKTNGGRLRIGYSITLAGPINAQQYTAIFVDGIQVGRAQSSGAPATGYVFSQSDTAEALVGAGVHKVDVYWLVNTGTTLTAVSTQRQLVAEEL